MIHNISIERLEEIDIERERTMHDKSFQAWMKELGVSRLAIKHRDQASEMMNLWTNKYGDRNSFNYVISKLK